MMEVGTVMELVSTLGFPIALAIGMAFMIYKVFCWSREDTKERESKDRETIEKFSGIISENSKALLKNSETMERIANKLEYVDGKINDIQTDVELIKERQSK